MPSNTVSWTTGVSGSWTLASDWSGDSTPTATSTVVIAATPVNGPYTVEIAAPEAAASVTLDQTSATLLIDQGGSLAANITLQAGTLAIDNGTYSGTLTGGGGSLVEENTDVSSSSATLHASSIAGQVSMQMLTQSYSNDVLTIAGGLNFASGTSLTVGQRVSFYSVTDFIHFTGTETIDGGTLVVQPGISLDIGQSAADTVTLGSAMVVDVNGNGALLNGAGTLVNRGVLDLSGTAVLTVPVFSNAGLMDISSGASLTLAGNVSNSGTIRIDSGGTLSTQAGAIAGGGSITVAGGGTYAVSGAAATVAQLEAPVYASGGVAALYGTLQNSGVLSVGGAALPSLVLGQLALIEGGTLVTNGQVSVIDGTLAGITVQGPLSVGSTSGPAIGYQSDLTISGAVAFTAGSTLALQTQGELLLNGGSTLTGATIVAAGGALAYGAGFSGGNSTLNGDTLTVTAGGTLYLSGSGSLFSTGSIVLGAASTLDSAQTTLVNAGSVLVSAGATLNAGENGAVFFNSGVLTISGAGALAEIGLSNSGTVNVMSGGDLSLSSLSNSGTIAMASGSTLTVAGALTSGALSAIVPSSGVTLDVPGELLNSGTTLTIGAGSQFGTLAGTGEISGGVIRDQGNGLGNFSGTLAGVTYEGALTIGSDQTITLGSPTVFTGASGTGAGTILLGGDGGGTLAVGNASSGYLSALSIIESGAGASVITGGLSYTNVALTLSASVNIVQHGNNLSLGSYPTFASEIDSAAQVSDAVAGSTLTLAGDFNNSGAIKVSNNATLALDLSSFSNTGTVSVTNGVLAVEQAALNQLGGIAATNSILDVSGTLYLENGTLSTAGSPYTAIQIGGTSSSPVIGYASVTDGTVADPTGKIQFGGNTLLELMTWRGILDVSHPLATVELGPDFAITGAMGTGAGKIVISGAADVVSAGTLANASVLIGSATESLAGTANAAAALDVAMLAANVTVLQSGEYAAISDGMAGAITAGRIAGSVAGGTMTLGFAQATGSSVISASNGDTLVATAAQFLNAGTISLAGSGTTLDLSLLAFYQQSAIGESVINTGRMAMSGATIGELTDGGALPAVPILNDGSIAGSGVIAAGLVNNKLVLASGGTLTITGGISGHGMLSIGASAALILDGVVLHGQTVSFGGAAAELGVNAPVFLGTLSGLAAGDKIDLLHEAATAAKFSGDSIVVTLSNGSTLNLATSTAETGSITVASDGAGGSLLTIASASPHAAALPAHGMDVFGAHVPVAIL